MQKKALLIKEGPNQKPAVKKKFIYLNIQQSPAIKQELTMGKREFQWGHN
jgi:hypothetical protein